jgi:hypothetical protein
VPGERVIHAMDLQSSFATNSHTAAGSCSSYCLLFHSFFFVRNIIRMHQKMMHQ